jgi:hypothetical protein
MRTAAWCFGGACFCRRFVFLFIRASSSLLGVFLKSRPRFNGSTDAHKIKQKEHVQATAFMY